MIQFENVWKVYRGGVEAVKDLSFEVREGETLVLLGSSGCGKTTTMKMVNRLIESTKGTIRIEGRDVQDHNPIELRRNIGYAIQHVGLFPHMSVAENIAIVPKLLKWDEGQIGERIDELLEMVGLPADDFRSRFPAQLSGGQRQRIGVARALAADPPLILMDEPFGALDPITREQLQDEFLSLESDIQKTVLFVTHDIFEAVKMADRIALLHDGQLQQLSTPAELVETPANEFVEQFLGQHRFQLSLLTRTLRQNIEPAQESEEVEQLPKVFLRPHHSLIEALDTLKTHRMDKLPVFDHKKRIGTLTKTHLLSLITEALGETAEDGNGAS